jgi:hypothetical protein
MNPLPCSISNLGAGRSSTGINNRNRRNCGVVSPSSPRRTSQGDGFRVALGYVLIKRISSSRYLPVVWGLSPTARRNIEINRRCRADGVTAPIDLDGRPQIIQRLSWSSWHDAHPFLSLLRKRGYTHADKEHKGQHAKSQPNQHSLCHSALLSRLGFCPSELPKELFYGLFTTSDHNRIMFHFRGSVVCFPLV